jgi:hypothetical protein
MAKVLKMKRKSMLVFQMYLTKFVVPTMKKQVFKFSYNVDGADEKVYKVYTPGAVFTTFQFLRNL